jgi:DNA helicase-2/ATP-dependent DNA helicase PcrA
MEEVALVSDVDQYDADADAVVLMTIHSAKGLEFPIVFLPGLEEGIFPGIQALESPSELSEERRLAYVAITRAKKRLFISHTVERMIYGRTSHNPLSRFVSREIPRDLLQIDSFTRDFGGYPRRPAAQPTVNRAELNRPVSAAPQKPKNPSNYGIPRYPAGTRVSHPTFGVGTVREMREMGGDVLYTVAFDDASVGVKKLMATFARLQKL